MAMRVDVALRGGAVAGGLFVHPRMVPAVGTATAAFASALLRGGLGGAPPGVWYPEELPLGMREAILAEATDPKGAEPPSRYLINKAPWTWATDAKEIGFGIFWE